MRWKTFRTCATMGRGSRCRNCPQDRVWTERTDTTFLKRRGKVEHKRWGRRSIYSKLRQLKVCEGLGAGQRRGGKGQLYCVRSKQRKPRCERVALIEIFSSGFLVGGNRNYQAGGGKKRESPQGDRRKPRTKLTLVKAYTRRQAQLSNQSTDIRKEDEKPIWPDNKGNPQF